MLKKEGLFLPSKISGYYKYRITPARWLVTGDNLELTYYGVDPEHGEYQLVDGSDGDPFSFYLEEQKLYDNVYTKIKGEALITWPIPEDGSDPFYEGFRYILSLNGENRLIETTVLHFSNEGTVINPPFDIFVSALKSGKTFDLGIQVLDFFSGGKWP